MDIWLIRSNCGDYYCGCGGGHVLGIATSESGANQIAEEAREDTFTYTSIIRTGSGPFHLRRTRKKDVQRQRWDHVYVDGPLSANTYSSEGE